jgi:hypothetical protein
VNGDFAAVGVFQAIKQAQQRRFSGAAAADNAENFALTSVRSISCSACTPLG